MDPQGHRAAHRNYLSLRTNTLVASASCSFLRAKTLRRILETMTVASLSGCGKSQSGLSGHSVHISSHSQGQTLQVTETPLVSKFVGFGC